MRCGAACEMVTNRSARTGEGTGAALPLCRTPLGPDNPLPGRARGDHGGPRKVRGESGPSGEVARQWPQCTATQLRASSGCLEQCSRCWSPVCAVRTRLPGRSQRGLRGDKRGPLGVFEWPQQYLYAVEPGAHPWCLGPACPHRLGGPEARPGHLDTTLRMWGCSPPVCGNGPGNAYARRGYVLARKDP